MSRQLLIELGTEELPPLALGRLSQAFADSIVEGLASAGVLTDSRQARYQNFATPRRLAVLINDVPDSAPDRDQERLGPNVKAAYDDSGAPSKAALGFAASCGVEFSELGTLDTPKGERLVHRFCEPGRSTEAVLADLLPAVLSGLPIPKRMRWGALRDEFIRPVKWLLALLGEQTLQLSVFGLQAGQITLGHRFMSQAEGNRPARLTVSSAADYETSLEQMGFVIADAGKRKQRIRDQLVACGAELGGQVVVDESLLDEVCSLVEWPCCIAGSFDPEFLQLPEEALISSMQSHQKYFHVLNSDGKLLPHFVTVANIDSNNPQAIIEGNERVIRPRLADAQFFYANDTRRSLDDMASQLDRVVFQDQLGTIGAKVERIKAVAEQLLMLHAPDATTERAHCVQAARLCKADLVSEMVGEFADLQGTMGKYYAEHSGKPDAVAVAIEEHYLPRFAGDRLPQTLVGQCVSLADRLDTIVGIFGVGQGPTGSKDPFALRRASLGVLRILIEQGMEFSLAELVGVAEQQHQQLPISDAAQAALDYMLERLRGWYGEQGFRTEVINAVLQGGMDKPLDIDRRVRAVAEFQKLPEAATLAAANKRVRNLLSKQNIDRDLGLDPTLFQHDQERELANALAAQEAAIKPRLEQFDYSSALTSLADLKAPVDAFFDHVMVMDEDLQQRNNRLALLQRLHALFGLIADISQLAQ